MGPRASAASWDGEGSLLTICGIDEVNFPPARRRSWSSRTLGAEVVLVRGWRLRGKGVGIYTQSSRSKGVSYMLRWSSDRCG